MDYSRLSRETLIHEIDKLNRELAKEKMFNKAEAKGMEQILNQSPVPIYSVGKDYQILWANAAAFDAMVSLDHAKCYQIFFGREDICTDCKVEVVIDEKYMKMVRAQSGEDLIEVHQFPLLTGEGILEVHIPQHDKEIEFKTLKAELDKALVKQKVLETELGMHQAFMARWIKMIRTPLRALNGFFQMDSVQRPYYIETLKNTSQKLYELLSKLTVYEMQASKSHQSVIEPFNFKKMMTQVTDQARLFLSGMGMVNDITLNFSNTIPEVIKGDGLKMHMMVSYLYEWLLIKTDHQPIHCDVLEINQTHEDIHLNIFMRSNIKKQKMHEANRIDAYAAELGVEIISEIAKQFNFKLDVKESVDGEYTIQVICQFDKFVPIYAPSQDSLIDDNRKLRILIADYEKPEIGLEIFENYEIHFSKTGAETLKVYFDLLPDLTLINVSIEDPDGFEVFDEIQRRRTIKRPVVAISYKLIDNEKLFMEDYGFDDYLVKPLTSRTLIEIIKRYE